MKVLVFGAGVIGGQLAHALSLSGNDVTVVARGAWVATCARRRARSASSFWTRRARRTAC
ncbi:MAG: hypothetical protein E7425_07045 [Ruminococcaceae bacterium]|nr:hypothetical protein [Oscillospiraceae bacterium]